MASRKLTLNLLLATTVALTVIPAIAARAQLVDSTRTLAVEGYWSAYEGIQNGRVTMCGADTYWGTQGNATGGMYLKYQATSPNALFMHIYKYNWNIRPGQRMWVDFQVDGAPVRHYLANAIKPDMIQIYMNTADHDPITGDSMASVLSSLLSHGVSLRISFPDGTEPAWTAQLWGARTVLGSFVTCGYEMMAGNGGPTSPAPYAPAVPPTSPAPPVGRTSPAPPDSPDSMQSESDKGVF